jgi:hypothetical protein
MINEFYMYDKYKIIISVDVRPFRKVNILVQKNLENKLSMQILQQQRFTAYPYTYTVYIVLSKVKMFLCLLHEIEYSVRFTSYRKSLAGYIRICK